MSRTPFGDCSHMGTRLRCIQDSRVHKSLFPSKIAGTLLDVIRAREGDETMKTLFGAVAGPWRLGPCSCRTTSASVARSAAIDDADDADARGPGWRRQAVSGAGRPGRLGSAARGPAVRVVALRHDDSGSGRAVWVYAAIRQSHAPYAAAAICHRAGGRQRAGSSRRDPARRVRGEAARSWQKSALLIGGSAGAGAGVGALMGGKKGALAGAAIGGGAAAIYDQVKRH